FGYRARWSPNACRRRPQGRAAPGSALRSSFWSRSSSRRRADITFGGDIGARPRTPTRGQRRRAALVHRAPGAPAHARASRDRTLSVQREISSQSPEILLHPPSSSESRAVAMLQPNAIREEVMPSSKSRHVLAPEEIELLMKQGEQMIAAGDVATV